VARGREDSRPVRGGDGNDKELALLPARCAHVGAGGGHVVAETHDVPARGDGNDKELALLLNRPGFPGGSEP
jgi:hypothetical protein